MTLLEIQKAADALSIEEKRELIIFLLKRLRGIQEALPAVRDIPKETIEKWIEGDEAIQNLQNPRRSSSESVPNALQ